MTINTGSSTGGAPAIPFNQSNTFASNQVLMFDTTLNAFVNTALPVGGTTGEINTASNLGAGQNVFKDKLGADLRFRTIVAGAGIAVTSDSDEVFIATTGTGSGDITGGTSTGTGNAVFRDKSGANLQFRSLTAGTNVTLTQNANDIVINAGTNALTLNNIADTGYVKVANNLSDVTAATARTNLAISSTAEADAKYIHLNTSKSPTADGTISLGTGVKRFNEIYAVSFKGNADTATVASAMTGFTPGNYLAKAGGTMAGTLVLSGAPTANLHAATKLYVDTATAALISSAPGVLNTLNELAAAIGDDANFATTMTNSIATKLALAGGTLTGALTLAGNPAGALIAAPKQYVDAGDALQLTKTSNLSDLANAATARTNLGLGTAATTATGAYLAAGTLTTGVAEGTNLYFTNARADARIAAADTDDLSEGSTNLYHTIARAKAATVLDAIVNGVTDVAPSQNAVFDALALKEGTITAGANTTYYRGDKTFQALNTTAVAEGTNLYHTNARADARIAAASISALSNVHTAAPTDGQILKWVNANSRWEPASHSTLIGVNEINDTHIDWGTGANQVSTADVPEQTNLYYTDARANTAFDTRLATKTTANLAENTNLYFTNARADARADVRIAAANINALANVHTAAPTDGQVLKWDNSNTRWAPAADTDTVYGSFNADFDTRLATKTTANLAENTNLYFTNARADARITAAVGTTVQGIDADLTAIGALAKTDGNFIVANGTTWVAENAATARTSLGLGTMATALTSVYYTKVETDARFANVVGTGANLADIANASAARTNLGLGTAAVANTTAFADPLLSNLTNNATARTNLGTIGFTEGDARYVRLDVNYLPTADNAITLGDTTKRFNTIHARQFKGQMSGSFDSSMTTGDLLEGSNLYFTNARADARAQLKIDALVASAPGALDTLNELAAAIGDDANFSTTMTNALAGKEPTLAAGTTAQYYKGNKTWATLDTVAVAENTNLYFTTARAKAAAVADAIANGVTDVAPSQNAVFDALALKEGTITAAATTTYYRGDKTFQTLNTTAVAEGTNQYFSNARADGRIAAASIDALADVVTTSLSPTNNQVLTWVTANSRWEPATVSGGGAGEANDGANVGTAGVGTYDGKAGATLQFRKLNSLDANLTIVNDNTNNKIDFDLNDDVMLITENLAGITKPTARTNLGLGVQDSPVFGGVGTGSITVEATPSAGPVAPTYSGIIFRSIPVPSGSGHKWLFGNEADGDHSFSYYSINDAGANTSSGETYIMARPTGTKFVSIAGTGIRTYINNLYYPEADGTAGQVLKTDGAGVLSWTTVGGSGTVTSIIAGTGLTGGTITTTGTIALAANGVNDTHIDWGTGSNQVSTGDIPEATNLYYTDARADARIGAAALSALSNVHTAAPTDGQVLKWDNGNSRWAPAADAGGIALTDLSVTTAAAGTAALAYNNGTGVFTYTPPNLSSYLTSIAANSINDTHIDWGTGSNQVSTADIPESGNLFYTDARADARIGAANINALANVHTAAPTDGQVLKWVNANSRWEPSADTGLTTEQVQDISGAMFTGNTETLITATYQDGDGTIDLVVDNNLANYSNASSGFLTSIAANSINDTHIDWGTGANQVSTADVPEQTNLYYTDARADARVAAGTGTIATQDANAVNIDGGAIDGTIIGANSRSTAQFTTLSANSTTTLSNTNISAGDSIRFIEASAGPNYVGFKAPFNIYTDTLWALPNADGTNGQVLKTDGAGNLGWLTASGTGTVTNVATGTGLTGGPITTTGTVAVDVGTTASKIVQLDGSARLPAVDGSQLTNLPTLTDEQVQDKVGAMFGSNTETLITATYQDSDGTIDLVVDNNLANYSNASSGFLTSIAANSINDTHIDWGTGANQVSTADVPENTNLYYTDARADARVAAGSINNVVEDTTPQLGGTLDANGNIIDMGSNNITDAKVGQWDTAYTHSQAAHAPSGAEVNQNAFTTIAVSGQTDVVADAKSDTLTFVAGSNVTLTTTPGTDTLTIAASGGGSQNVFSTFAVSGQSNVVADATTDTLTLAAGSNMTITTNAGSDTITFASTGGGGGTVDYEEFKCNYHTDGTLLAASNVSSGISGVTIDSAAGGDVTVTFTGYTTPPIGIMFYGYGYASNVYNMNTLGSTGTTLRELPGGGSSGSPTAFGSFSTLKLKIREAETGASRSFGTVTHAWIRFVMGA